MGNRNAGVGRHATLVRGWLEQNRDLWSHKSEWSMAEVDIFVKPVQMAFYSDRTARKFIRKTIWYELGLLQGRNVIR